MQIALTKKLADAMKIKVSMSDEAIDPLFSWTANWTRVWDNRKAEDMLVLVNNATRFTVAIYQVKRKDLKNVEKIMRDAIENTLLSMNFNPELVSEYMRQAGDLAFTKNNSRQAASWVTRAGLECAWFIGREYNDVPKMYSDTLGSSANHRSVNYSQNRDNIFYPYKAMADALTKLTGMQTYKVRAYELMVSLDLEIYQAERRLMVPATMKLSQLHKVLQWVYNWKNYHLYDFSVIGEKSSETILRLVPNVDDLEFDDHAVLMEEHTISDIFPEHDRMIYTYDMGDNWEHVIKLVRVIEEYDGELPYLMEATGQSPPEDVGGVGGFLRFRSIMLDPNNREYREMSSWAMYWTPDLREWESRPRVLHI